MYPELSVIVPVFNEAKYLEATLQTIVNQNTNVPYELIVSENGSTDESIDIAKKYTRHVLNCEERGIGAARHFGAVHASETSKYFLFIDADTHIPGYYLAYLYETFKTYPDLIAFSTGFKFSELSEQIKVAESIANKYFIMRDILRSVTLPGFNTAVRREAYFKCGGYRNVLLEDVDFSRRIDKLGTVRFFPHVKVVNSSRRLEAMGLLGTLYYYAQMDLGWELNSTWVDKLTKKMGIADLREYIGIRK
ncbi:MAG: glycosyltransferase [Candidatus Methanoperedens sp.]|nr:glycosyltransferase [Candidatus Methanoperedens sp.]